jgi:hypothetical protein
VRLDRIWLVGRKVHQSIDLSVGWSVGRLVGWLMARLYSYAPLRGLRHNYKACYHTMHSGICLLVATLRVSMLALLNCKERIMHDRPISK